jgi:hypothetical protein
MEDLYFYHDVSFVGPIVLYKKVKEDSNKVFVKIIVDSSFKGHFINNPVFKAKWSKSFYGIKKGKKVIDNKEEFFDSLFGKGEKYL